MTDEKKYTERDLVLARREENAGARCAALFMVQSHKEPWHQAYYRGACDECRKVAAERHPLPKVTRPRVVADPHGSGIAFRAMDDLIQWSGNASLGEKAIWQRERTELVAWIPPTRQRVKLWVDLLERPTEDVDADD